MSAISYKAIVLKSSDYNEYDKRLTLFTENEGVVCAVIKGIKKKTAKLKFAGEIFGFNEYQLVNKNGFFTVANATQIESFFEFSKNHDNFLSVTAMLEVTEKSVGDSPSGELFIKLLKAFKAILYGNKNPYLVAMRYTYYALAFAGYDSTPEKIQEFDFDILPNEVRFEPVTYLKEAINILEQRLGVRLMVRIAL
ncbi:MAG: DNA repair protein RecO [Firmicutes bacterium]|nr:DNA repair protein RecO [Bacillota bacterium]